MKDFDYEAAVQEIEKLVASGADASTCMRKLIAYASRRQRHSHWNRVRSLAFADDVKNLCVWLAKVLTESPPPPSIKGLWFGLFEPIQPNGRATCGFSVAGSKRFDPHDLSGEWAAGPCDYFPEGRYASSAVLKALYELGHRRGGLGQLADYLGCFGYAAFAVAELCRTIEPRTLIGKAKRRGVAVGFDSGDFILICEVSGRGLATGSDWKARYPLRPRGIPKVPFYRIQPDAQGSWLLDDPVAADGEELVCGFASMGVPVDVKLPLRSKIISGKKRPVDFSFDTFGNPVVRRRVGEVVAKLAPQTVQRLPLRIERVKDAYEVLNVIDVVPCIDSKRCELYAGFKAKLDPQKPDFTSVKTFALTSAAQGHHIFRAQEYDSLLVVSAEMRRLLESARVTGIAFEPVRVFR
jgi:hypothetical protein